ncbi:DNA-binding transcriptional MocR family regulator [Kineococcus radiotolerans]|uniref:DNA-binding transcriptional MocR family regulator n=1 Tax=Kineococcus radiotolerans TaxID=131568 RepID=A0A7W4TMY7_KINRA|nr:PLP-dependent aminotransferase family protein [Kineococcus radiotolerans]MBB2901913.1 DNA-binding transcriptional MocR family regulator [Kineococcus radiotolerans]
MNDDSTSRIVAELRAWVDTAAPGARLPSNRELVARFAVSPVTVQKAFRRLTAAGLVESRPGVGTFVRPARPVRPADYGWQTAALRAPHTRPPAVSAPVRAAAPDAVALHSGYPALDLLPERLLRNAFARAGRGEAGWTRSPVEGHPDLRAWFAAELAAVTAPGTTAPTARDVVVLPGTQSGLCSVFRALAGAGQPVLVESPTYWGALLAAAQAGVDVVPVRGGPQGPDPADLARAFTESGARVFYAQPTFANPTGVRWSARRVEEVLDVVRAHDAFLIEDDWAHDFALDGEVTPAAARDDGGHVVHLRSLTKSVSPAVRVGALVARGPARERIVADRLAESVYVSGVLQAAALEVVTAPGWRTHLRSMRHRLRARRDLMVEELARHVPGAHLPLVPAGGLNLWVRLPDATDVQRLVGECEREGVVVAAGDEWFPAEPSGPFVRLNYSGPEPERFGEGLAVLGRVLARQEG